MELDRFLSDDGGLIKLESLVIRALSAYYLGLDLSNEQAEDLQKLHNKVDSELNNLAKDASVILQDINNELSEIEGLGIDLAEEAFDTAYRLSTEVESIEDDIIDAETKLLDELQELQKYERTVKVKVVEEVCDKLDPLGLFCLIARKIVRFEDRINPRWRALDDAIKLRRGTIGTLRSGRDELKPKLRSAIREGFAFVRNTHEQKRILLNQVISVLESNPFGPPHRQLFAQWRNNIPIALVEFSRANAVAIVNSIDPDNPSALAPLKRWLLCYGPALTPIPAHIVETGCVSWDAIESIRKSITDFETELSKIDPILSEVFELRAQIESEISDLKDSIFSSAIVAGLEEFDKLANTDSVSIFKGLTESVSVGDVNKKFDSDTSAQNLPVFANAGERIMQEMHVENMIFNARKFNAVYNSIALSKLSLLGKSELRKMAKSVDLGTTTYGEWLYSGNSPDSENILFGFIRSIDGNHQWHELSPPHPRGNGEVYDAADYSDRAAKVDKRFGYADTGCG